MMKITVFCIFLLNILQLNAQSYVGFFADNYSGVNSVVFNPANSVDSRFKTDINIGGISLYAGNNYYGVNVFDALKSDYDFESQAYKTPLSNNSGLFNLDVLGPSFLVNLTPKSAMALFTRARSFLNVPEVKGSLVNVKGNFENIIKNDLRDFYVNQNNLGVFSQSWAELGLSYARVIKDEGENFLKGGVTVKYLQGAGSAYLYAYDENTLLTSNPPGGIIAGYYDNTFSDVNYQYKLPKAMGFGVDLGFVYEWRPHYEEYVLSNARGNTEVLKDMNKYKFKLGISITDIGSMNYKNGQTDNYYNLDSGINGQNFNEGDNFYIALDSIYKNKETSFGYKTTLPAALHLNVDWNLYCKLYLNFNTDLSLTKKTNKATSSIANMMSFAPRYESKHFSVFMPLNVVHTSFTAGIGFRVGPLYVGSGSVISALISDHSKSADVYAGFKIPIYQSSSDELIKDRDRDGVIDKLDVCPDEPGLAKKSGCPEKVVNVKKVKKVDKVQSDENALNRLLKMLFFDNGAATIKAKSIGPLNQIVRILNKYPKSHFLIEGHTDDKGSREVNQKLSEDRANAVMLFLIEKGVDSKRLSAIGYGEDKPITDNITGTGRSINRRVEIKIIKEKQ